MSYFQIAAATKSLQSYPALCNPMDDSSPGSSVHGFSRQEYWSGLPCPSPRDLPGLIFRLIRNFVQTHTQHKV